MLLAKTSNYTVSFLNFFVLNMLMASLGFKPKHKGFSRNKSMGRFIIPAIIIIALAVIILLSMGGVTSITQTQTLSLKQGSAIQLKVYSSVFSLYLNNVSSSSAGVLISQSPVLSSTIISFMLNSNSSLNISTSGNRNADLQIKLITSNSTYAKLQLTPVPSGLIIPVSYGIGSSQPSSLSQGSSSNQVTTVQTTIPQSSSQSTSVSTSLTTGASTTVTTTSPSQNIPQSIVNDASNSYIGKLTFNLNVLYAQESQCSESLYNQTLMTDTGQKPTGPFSYANVTLNTPTLITQVIIGPINSNYVVNYTSKSNIKQYSGTAITLLLNASTGTISNIKFLGIFQGANYTDLENSYNFQSGIGNACAAYIPYLG